MSQPDTLREKLEKLVEEIDHDIPVLQASKSIKHRTAAGTLRGVRAKLAAILAESEEPKPDPFDAWRCPCHHGSVCGEACKKGQHHGGCPAEPRYLRPIPGMPLTRVPKLEPGDQWDSPDGRTHYVGDECEGGHAEVGEVKPLPLGHPYSTFVNGNGPCTACIPTIVSPPGERPVREAWRCCGQPRSAHEPLPAPSPSPSCKHV